MAHACSSARLQATRRTPAVRMALWRRPAGWLCFVVVVHEYRSLNLLSPLAMARSTE